MRISKVTTKTGDKGQTKLGDGSEVSKSYIRIECLGQIDELNSMIGFACSVCKDKNFIRINNRSLKIPKMLFNQDDKVNYDSEIKEALIFNKSLLMENFILPNKLRFPLFRKILEKYYN